MTKQRRIKLVKRTVITLLGLYPFPVEVSTSIKGFIVTQPKFYFKQLLATISNIL